MNEKTINIRAIQHYMYCPRRFALLEINDDWEENASLKLSIDSAAIHSIYGNPCKKTEVDFSIKRFEEYANFYLK